MLTLCRSCHTECVLLLFSLGTKCEDRWCRIVVTNCGDRCWWSMLMMTTHKAQILNWIARQFGACISCMQSLVLCMDGSKTSLQFQFATTSLGPWSIQTACRTQTVHRCSNAIWVHKSQQRLG